jgi:hypothetical protein
MPEERMRVTVVFEYAVDPDRYPGTTTPADRAEIDRVAFAQNADALGASVSLETIKSITVTPMSVGF